MNIALFRAFSNAFLAVTIFNDIAGYVKSSINFNSYISGFQLVPKFSRLREKLRAIFGMGTKNLFKKIGSLKKNWEYNYSVCQTEAILREMRFGSNNREGYRIDM